MNSLRTDAQRNRLRLLDSAAEVLREQGLDASLDEISRRAGVGNATLYRHFPSREELLEAVYLEQVDARRRSPGRDIANSLGIDPGGAAYKVTSGAADAIWSFTYDPTLILGKINKGAKVLKYGVGDFSDAGRIESLMRGNNQVKRGWNQIGRAHV